MTKQNNNQSLFHPVSMDESKRINNFIVSLEDEKRCFPDGDLDLWGIGKAIRYIGWFWREVDFTRPFDLGLCANDDGTGCKPFVGFMENNKWGYDSWEVSQEQYEAIVSALRSLQAMDRVTPDAIREFDELMQRCTKDTPND